MERLLARFRSAHTQVLGVSVDSVFSHANWAQSMGGISFPLMSDFHPKGAMASSYGTYLADRGITDRATIFIDAKGVVRHSSSVTPAGQRNIEDLATMCATLDQEHGGGLPEFPAPQGIEPGAILYIKSQCGASRAVMLARQNLHLDQRLPVCNVSEDPAAHDALLQIAGVDQAPCFVAGGKPLHESKAIISRLVSAATDIPG